MCRRIQFSFSGFSVGAAYEGATRALLPVRRLSGRDELIPWGRKDGEPGSSERLPCVMMDTVKSGAWEAFKPRWVKLYVERFQVLDADGRPVWHSVPAGSFVQGVLITDTDPGETQRVYVAAVEAPAGKTRDGAWPHIFQPEDQPPGG